MEMGLSTVILTLGSLLQTAGSPVPVFSQTGGSITLEFQQHQQVEKKSIDIIQWHFGSGKIMKYVPHKDTVTVFTHEDRVEFNKETFSLELKNLQNNDSGLYRGEIIAGVRDVKVHHNLTVLDPVEAPVLSVVSNSSSGDSCNVTVTCRGQHSLPFSLISSCNSRSRTCSPEGGTSSDSTLTLSVRGGRIICNHSNPVSWRNDTIEMIQSCQMDPELSISGNPVWIPLVCCSLGALVCCSIMYFWKWKPVERAASQTLYAEVMGTPQTAPTVESPYEEVSIQTRDDNKTLNPTKDPSCNGKDLYQGATLASDQSVTSVYSMLQPS